MTYEPVHCQWLAQCPCSPHECELCPCNPANEQTGADANQTTETAAESTESNQAE